MNQTAYESPSRSRLMSRLENKLLGADDSWFTDRHPATTRFVAEVPCALYLNFLASKSYVASLCPRFFRPLALPGRDTATLFTILLFTLECARPLWAPRALGHLVPRIIQSNWRFYGHLTEAGSDPRPSVLFVRTVTTSLALSIFGRRLARCFPLHRAHRMTLERASRNLTGMIIPGRGSAPELVFEGEQIESPQLNDLLQSQFSTYNDYSRWIIDQHLSLVIWPREYVMQNMHLDFRAAKITPLRCLGCRISALEDFALEEAKPFDCFVVEDLRVFLDKIYSVSKD